MGFFPRGIRFSFLSFLVAAFALLAFARAHALSRATQFFELTLSQTQYSGQPQIVEQDKQYSSVVPAFKIYRQSGSLENSHSLFLAEGQAVVPMSDGVDLGVAVPEIYYQNVPLPNKFGLSIGRKKERWSELDSYWKLGLWQPLVRWDAANPIEQGLTGAFFEYGSTETAKATLMVSGLFLPDQQPSFSEKDGRLVSANRWFRAPVNRAKFEESTQPIRYEVRAPDSKNIVLQNTYAALLQVGDEDVGPVVKLSLADKPMNQFHVAIDAGLLTETSDSHVAAPIYPMSIRHRVYSLESSYRGADFRILASTNWEYFEKPNVEEGWQQTPLVDGRYDGLIYTQSLSPIGLRRTEVGLSYVHKYDRQNTRESTIIKGDIEASTQRFPFQELVGLQVSSNMLRSYRRELDAMLKYVYSVQDQGEWIQAGLQYRHERSWVWALSGDVLGVPKEHDKSSSFISRFRGNDRVTGSVTYVF